MLDVSDADSNGMIGADIRFNRARRITGYLSPLNRFNNAKQAEVKDRVKHFKLSSNQYASKAKEVEQ